MKLILITIVMFLYSCSHSSSQMKKIQRPELKGIWIPEKINWEEGNFNTYYFPNDSSVIIFSSVQKKINDSIHFNTEEGFNIFKGSLIFSSDTNVIIKAKTIYRFIKITDSAGNEIHSDTSIVLTLPKDSIKSIQLNNSTYIRAIQYTEESKHSIISIATKMVSDIEKHPERFK